MAEVKTEISKFFTTVLLNGSNPLTVRNKFKISWTPLNAGYSPTFSGSYYHGHSYSDVRTMLLNAFNGPFTYYVDHIEVPGLSIDGDSIDDGLGHFYYQKNSMMVPERNSLSVYYREAQVSVVDMANMWMEMSSRPWIRPIRMNLIMDYYSDVDGKTPVMSYEVIGCTPREIDLINCYHDRKEIMLRKIEFGINTIVPIGTSGTSRNGNGGPIIGNWNALASLR